MEKIIIIAPKQEFQNIRLLISGMAKRTVDVLLIDPKNTPNYEEIIKEANTNLICTLDDIEEKLRNSIEEFNRTLKFEHIPHVEVDTKKLIDTTPDTLKKEISEEFNKVFKLKSQKFLDENIIIDETPWYDRFLKK